MLQVEKKIGDEVFPLVNLQTNLSVNQIESVVFRAFDLKELKESGASFNYPDSLSSIEWIALKKIISAKEIAEYKEMKKKKPKS